MPWLKALPTWLAVNNCNFSSPTALTDQYTGQPYTGGQINVGDYTDLDNETAASLSYTTNGTLFAGRYRYVQVDSSATAAYVKTGTVGYLRKGTSVSSVRITGAGTGQTNGTYSIAGVGGGGVGALVSVTIAGGLVTQATVVQGGYGYATEPTFTISEGGTPGTLQAQLNSTPNLVTSYDQAVSNGFGPGAVRQVVFLNAITPGNYGFVQEDGIATVLGNGTIGTAAEGNWVNSTTGGTVNATAANGSPIGATIGKAIDLPLASNLFKIYLTAAGVCG